MACSCWPPTCTTRHRPSWPPSTASPSKRTADEIAEVALAQVEKGKHIILTDREGKLAYVAKRFLRPLYYREMANAAVQMGRKD